MKILLISPPFYRILGFYNRYFPLGITVLATLLKEDGHETKVIDADFTSNPSEIDYAKLPEKYGEYSRILLEDGHPVWKEIENTVIDFQPDLIGISVFTTFAGSAFQTAKICKRVCNSCPVVMGGPHATAKADEILRISKDVDFVIRGDGETPLMQLTAYVEGKLSLLSDIPGVSYRKGSEIHHNSMCEANAEVDALPIPDRTLLMNEILYSSEDMGLIMTTRGCPFRCTFCASDINRVTYRSIEDVIKEMQDVQKRYGTHQFTFKDDSFTVNRKRVLEFCDKLIQSGLKTRWECNTRVGLIDEGMLKKMKMAGCNFIKIGIESGSERILKEMHKGITLDQIRQTASLLRRSAIHWTGYFMMGVPGETEEDVRQTLLLMEAIKPDMALISVY